MCSETARSTPAASERDIECRHDDDAAADAEQSGDQARPTVGRRSDGRDHRQPMHQPVRQHSSRPSWKTTAILRAMGWPRLPMQPRGYSRRSDNTIRSQGRPGNNMTETSGGEVLARMLQAEGVEKVFGIIDGTYFGFYSSLHKLGIEIVTPRHETCAAHMAGAYARLTGRLGVCMASNGPGVANLLPGLVVENAEGNRVLAITSCRRPQIVYPDRGGAYQAFDQVGAIAHFAKWSARGRVVRSRRRTRPHGAAPLLRGPARRRAPRRARDHHERQGQGRGRRPGSRTSTGARMPIVPSPAQVERAADMLAAAELPMIHAGSGVIHAGAYDGAAPRGGTAARAGHHQLGRRAACCRRPRSWPSRCRTSSSTTRCATTPTWCWSSARGSARPTGGARRRTGATRRSRR